MELHHRQPRKPTPFFFLFRRTSSKDGPLTDFVFEVFETMGGSRTLRFPQETDSKRIHTVGIYKAKLAAGGSKKRQLRLYTICFLLLYVYQIGVVVRSIGQPYREFLEKADREGFQVMEGSTRLRAELERSVEGVNDPNRRNKKIGWMDWMDMDMEELAKEKKKDKEKSILDSLRK